MKLLGEQKKVILMKGGSISLSFACSHSLLMLFHLWSVTINMMNIKALA